MDAMTYDAAYECGEGMCDGCRWQVVHTMSYADYGGKTRRRSFVTCGFHGRMVGPEDEDCWWREERCS